MRSDPLDPAGGAGSGRAARGLLLAFLAFSLASRLADANPHPDLSYAPCVIACYLLPTCLALGWWSTGWERAPVLLLVLQALASYLPLIAFGQHWVPGVNGLLAGLCLVVLRAPVSWFVFGILLASEGVAWLVVGVPYEPAINAIIWLLVAYATVALGYFGLSDATRILEQLESTAEMLAGAAVDRQRLAIAEGLQSNIVRRLEDVQAHAHLALTAGTTKDAAVQLQLVGEAAREAAGSARRIISAVPRGPVPGTRGDSASPGFALGIVLAVVILYDLQFLMSTVFPVPGGGHPTVVTNIEQA